jgi:hypothetical protein
LIENKAYKKVSSEVFWNLKVGEKVYKRALAAVALLGANTPGVSNLNDILAMYSAKSEGCDKLAVYETNALELSDSEKTNKGGTMPEKSEQEIKLEYALNQKESDLKAANDKLSEAEKAQKEKDDEITRLREFKAQAEIKEQKLLADAQAAEVKNFVTGLKAEKLCTPAMEGLVTELLGETKKEYTVKVGDKDQKLSKQDLLKETLKLFKAAAEVNFEESSAQGDEGSKGNDEAMDKKAKEYMTEHKVNYSTALKAVMKENKK